MRRRVDDEGGEPSVPLEELDPLDFAITVDDDGELLERTTDPTLEAVVVRAADDAATRSGPANLRLANLETWRRSVDRWRLRLTGPDDTDGKLGKLAELLAELREDVGDRDECRRVRASADLVDLGRRRAIAAVITAGLALGGAAWAMIRSRDKDVAAETIRRMELELRVRNLEQRLNNGRTP